MMQRLRIDIQGYVQGVGFRPHVYHLATALNLTGWVKNNATGVQIEVQGHALTEFLQQLKTQQLSLAKIDTLSHQAIALKNSETTFRIKDSEAGQGASKISADVAVCDECLTELFDPTHHYYYYPFINCTQCGPRYTLTYQLPYDRKATSMHAFELCETCRSAYENPTDRRYHAQPIACHACGPRLSHDIARIVNAINAGKIVALKGLGGYQLICDANNQQATKNLRVRKQRATKPFAVMALNIASAKRIVHCTQQAEALLKSRARPIVLLEKKNQSLPDDIAPKLNTLGIMLPSTPLHYLLFHALLLKPQGFDWLNEGNDRVLIVTSANVAGSALIKDDEDAHEKLTAIADLIVSYDRDIVTRVDDSVVSILKEKPVFIRRARGYTPHAITLPYEIPPTLAFGGYLKNTICVTRGREAFISQHIGDLNHPTTREFYHATISHLLKLLAVKPACVAHDLHPDFYSSQIATEFKLPAFAIQHHHAHIGACAAEHGVTDDAVGLALDGFGLGDDFSSWGGELLQYQGMQYERVGSLKPLMQPGGDQVIQQPWRMAVSVLFELDEEVEIMRRFAHHTQAMSVLELLKKRMYSPMTSSCGRLFDAASALLGLCETTQYEGEAAMMLESQVTDVSIAKTGWRIQENQLNMLPLFKLLLRCDPVQGANLFHGTLANALAEWVMSYAREKQLTNVLLGGGCFLNKVLTREIIIKLQHTPLSVFYPSQCPPNDGAISLGQAWIAGNKYMEIG